jgi:hypothetical protein
MQRRVLAAAIALICANSVAVNAQQMPLQDDPVTMYGSHIRLMPYVGYMPAVTRHETWIHNDGTTNTRVLADYKIAAGNAVGVTAEMPMHGSFNYVAGVMYASRGESSFAFPSSGEEFGINGSRYLMARAGLSMTLHEKESELTSKRMGASLFATPFYMREMPRSESGFADADVFKASNHFGVTIGVNGELPFAQDRMSFQAGIEDNATWWSSKALSRLPDAFFNDPNTGATSNVETNVSHLWMLRAGLTYRLH